MIDGLIAGKLYGAAELRTDKAGRPYVLAKVLAKPHDGDSLFVNVITFDQDASDALMALNDGDTVSMTGHLTPKVWSDKQGNTRPALDMVAARVLSLHG